MFPSNEAETITLFRLLQGKLGWRIIESQKNAFPDAVIENTKGRRLNVEFEFEDRNFRKHGHPVDDSCDLIVCWRARWENPPLPVWELQTHAKDEAMEVYCLLSHYIPKQDLSGLNFQMGMLQRKIKRKDDEIARLNNIDRWFYKISGDVACLVMACGFFFWGIYRLLKWLTKVL